MEAAEESIISGRIRRKPVLTVGVKNIVATVGTVANRCKNR